MSKTVGTINGYAYGDAFLKAKNFTRSVTHKLLMNLKKLIHKRVDLKLEGEIVAREVIFREAPELKDKLTFTKKALSSNNEHVLSGRKNSKNKVIISAFNKGLAMIKQDGTFDSILKKHGMK